MNNSINLLHQEQEASPLTRRIQLLRMIAFGLLGGIVISTIVFYFFILTSPLPILRLQENDTKQRLLSLRSKSGKLYLTKDRLKLITTVLDGRSRMDQLFNEVAGVLPSDVKLDEIGADSTMLSLTFSSRSLESIMNGIDAMKTLQQRNIVKSIVLSKVSLDQEKEAYSVTLRSAL